MICLVVIGFILFREVEFQFILLRRVIRSSLKMFYKTNGLGSQQLLSLDTTVPIPSIMVAFAFTFAFALSFCQSHALLKYYRVNP